MKKKLGIRELIFWEVINNPIWWAELTWKRMGLKDDVTRKPWKVFDCRAWPMLATRHARLIFEGSGRNQSKSEQLKACEIKHFPIRSMMKGNRREAMFLSPNEVHQLTLINAIKEMKQDPFLRKLIVRDVVRPVRVDFVGNNILHGLIPGADGRNLPGHHVHEILGEESCLFKEGSLTHLGGCKNPMCSEHYYGTKTGDRSGNMYKYDTYESLGYVRFAIPTTARPNYEHMRDGFIQDFGGPGEVAWTQNILAEWGQRTNWAWRDAHIEKCFDEKLPMTHDVIAEEDIKADDADKYLPVDLVFRPLASNYKYTLVGWDVGFREDTEMLYWGSNDGKKWRLFHRVTIKRVQPKFQLEVFDRANAKYEVERVGIDQGGEGATVVALIEGNDVKDLWYDYTGRVSAVNFASKIEVGKKVKDDGTVESIMEYTKDATVRFIADMLYEGNLEFSDLNLKADMQSYYFTINSQGRYIYKTEKDHAISALMCFGQAWFDRFKKNLVADEYVPVAPVMISF